MASGFMYLQFLTCVHKKGLPSHQGSHICYGLGYCDIWNKIYGFKHPIAMHVFALLFYI